MATGSFSVSAWVSNGRVLHHRTRDHFGTETDTSVVLASQVGPYPAGTSLHTVILDLEARIAGLNPVLTAIGRFGSFTVEAFVVPTFRADAVIVRYDGLRSMTFDAVFVLGFSANALIQGPRTGSFSASALTV